MSIGVGIELGSSAIRIAILQEAQRSAPSVTRSKAHASRDTALGAGNAPRAFSAVTLQEISCDTSNTEALTRCLIHVRSTLRLSAPIVLGIPSGSAILSTINPLVVVPQRAALAVQFELQQQLPFDVSQATWHYHWLRNGNGSRRSSLEPHPRAVVAAVKRSLLDERLIACRRAGIAVKEVTANALASLNAWDALWSNLRLEAVALLHLISEETAEWIVRTPEQLQVVPVSSASAEALWQDLAQTWETLRASFGNRSPHVWVAGPPAALTNAQEFISMETVAAVERFDVTALLASGTAKLQQPERVMAAIGLALQALRAAKTPVNLLAGIQHLQRARLITQAAAVVSAICLCVTLLLGASGMWQLRSRRLHLLQQLEAREQLYQTLRPEVRAAFQQQRRMERRIQQLERLADHSSLVIRLMTQVVGLLPDDLWLTKLEGFRSELLPGQRATKTEVIDGMMEGHAKSFAAINSFMERLKALPELSIVKLVSTTPATDATSGREVIAFTIQLQRQIVEESVVDTGPEPSKKAKSAKAGSAAPERE
ncbi:MAG: PilN domain-containing protein [Candidatus Omnitrophica bacterium]|nr:PilN domain-containing protein [Candidatus Omnitrophota bacterium]